MKKYLAGVATALLLFGTVGIVNASPIELTWITTLESMDGSFSGFGLSGEAMTTIFTVDNGGTSTLSQSWDDTDFLSYRVEGASGWWLEGATINTGSSTGSFSTDALGNVIDAGVWMGHFFTGGTITTSWAGSIDGGWWNIGQNEVAAGKDPIGGVNANNVAENLVGANWTSKSSSPVPEPATVALLGIGIVGLVGAGARRKWKKKA